MADEPGDLKREELEVEKREKTGEEQGREEAGKREKEEGEGRGKDKRKVGRPTKREMMRRERDQTVYL